MKVLKSTLLLLAVFCTVLNMQSCKDDECEGELCNCPEGYTGTDCDNFDFEEVQFLLNTGKTPLELVDGNVPLSNIYGKMYEGGLIFYLNTNDGSGMVVATEDQSIGAEWGCSGQEIAGADGESVGAGTQNTMEIIMDCNTSGIAAKLCDELELNGQTDWFLPSKDELNLMWTNLADSDGDGQNLGTDDPANLAGFTASFYWSSTESANNKAWFQFFTNNGNQNTDFKTNLNHVRAIRRF